MTLETGCQRCRRNARKRLTAALVLGVCDGVLSGGGGGGGGGVLRLGVSDVPPYDSPS